MLPLVLTVPLALVGLDLVAPWPSALGVGVLPVLAPSDWTSEAARSRRLSPSYTCEERRVKVGDHVLVTADALELKREFAKNSSWKWEDEMSNILGTKQKVMEVLDDGQVIGLKARRASGLEVCRLFDNCKLWVPASCVSLQVTMQEELECEGWTELEYPSFWKARGWKGDAAVLRAAIGTNHTCEELNMPEREECETIRKNGVDFFSALWYGMVASCVWYVAQLIFMCPYKSSVTNRRPPLQPGAGAAQLNESGDFATGLGNCFDDFPTCLHACFCMACRAGDTYQSAGIIKYWHVIALFWVIVMVQYGWFGLKMVWPEELAWIPYSPSLILTCCIFYRFRRALRVKLGKKKAVQPNIFIDVLLFALCTCCVVAQEARAYDAATGVKVECCCKLTDAAGQPLYGQAQPLVGQPVQEDQGGSPSSSSSSSGA